MRKWFAISAVLALLIGVMAAPATAEQNPKNYTVVLKGDTITDADLAVVTGAGATVVRRIDAIGVLEVSAANPIAFVKAMANNPLIQAVGPTLDVELNLPTTDEPAANDGTSPTNPADPAAYTWGVERVTNNGAAWQIHQGTHDVVVGIIDTGIDYTHSDLVGNIVPGSKTFVPGTTDVFDQNSHGTHVAGTIAANGRIKGVAPGVAVRSYRVFGATGGAKQIWITDAIVAAANDGVDVINMSLGGERVHGQWYELDQSTGEWVKFGGDTADVVAYNRAIRYANRHNVTVVAAAGNDGWDLTKRGQLTRDYQAYLDATYGPVYRVQGATLDVPGQIPGVVTVSAMGGGFGTADRLAFYSNYGTGTIDVAGPGGDLGPNYPAQLDTDYYKYYILSTVPNNPTCVTAKRLFGTCTYGFKVGTSMATPHVTGVAALYISQQYALTGVKPSPAQVTAHLQQSAQDIGKVGADALFGHGLVNAYNILSGQK